MIIKTLETLDIKTIGDFYLLPLSKILNGNKRKR